MATILKNNGNISLNFTLGTILVLKPAPEDKSRAIYDLPFNLRLLNATGDTLLHMSISRTKATFQDYARRSLGDGRGKAKTVAVNLKYGDTVSIHHYLTDSEFGRYQILANGTTISHFDKRLPGSATQIVYTDALHLRNNYWGPSYWHVGVYQIDDLLPEDRLALVPGR